jgi:hypothetical protein
MASKGLRAISYQGIGKVEAGNDPSHTTETLIGYIALNPEPFQGRDSLYRIFS